MIIHFKAKSAFPEMQHLLVNQPKPFESFPILLELSTTYASEETYNNWDAVCVTYNSHIKALTLKKIIYFLWTITAIPILLCSNCEPCPKFTTFGIGVDQLGISLSLNSTYRVQYYQNGGSLFCAKSKCAAFRKEVKNGLVDPLKFYIDLGSMFTWKNSTYVAGRSGVMLKWMVKGLKCPVEFVVPKRNWTELPLPRTKIKCLQPFKLERLTIGSNR